MRERERERVHLKLSCEQFFFSSSLTGSNVCYISICFFYPRLHLISLIVSPNWMLIFLFNFFQIFRFALWIELNWIRIGIQLALDWMLFVKIRIAIELNIRPSCWNIHESQFVRSLVRSIRIVLPINLPFHAKSFQAIGIEIKIELKCMYCIKSIECNTRCGERADFLVN